jgi:hypothetical protein
MKDINAPIIVTLTIPRIMSLRNLWDYLPVDTLNYLRIIRSSRYIFNFSKDFFKYLYISLTVHHDINQFVITKLMHICFIS